MSESPFLAIAALLDDEKDKTEFFKTIAELELGPSDIELAKLMSTLQLYKAYYAKIPLAIKTVHEDALEEIRGLRNEVVAFTDRSHADAVEIGQWAEEIKSALTAIQPEIVAELLHKRLVEETMSSMAGSVQALAAAQSRINNATKQLDQASVRAEASIYLWQTLTMRRVWISAFAFSSIAVAIIYAVLWFIFFRQ